MRKLNHKSRFDPYGFLIVMILVFTPVMSSGQDALKHPETITVLQALYKGETTAHQTYSAFAKRALVEGYISVARLFAALRSSEAIHARNFKTILDRLNAPVDDFPQPEIHVSKTKENLKFALKGELSEIDTEYPEYINRIKPEEYKAAITDITYAWKAEKQHRDLIKKMKSGIALFFGKIVDELGTADKFFVCQRCGSTLSKLPKDSCPICDSPVLMYKECKFDE
ncbi:MAG: rubrerythrin family protein [Deltaproteobacteria bacterium]|nr:rubrerythrin family protein [Deltaproteobacteria bacterium]